jgi:hypothetical protein
MYYVLIFYQHNRLQLAATSTKPNRDTIYHSLYVGATAAGHKEGSCKAVKSTIVNVVQKSNAT